MISQSQKSQTGNAHAGERDKSLLSVLFVCHGNICRSPMAEFVMKKDLAEAGLASLISVDSAATSTEEIGNDVHPGAKFILQENKIPFYSRRARRISKDDYSNYNLIIGMDELNVADLRRFFDNDPQNKISLFMDWAGNSRGVADPWYTGDFQATYDDVVEGCGKITDHIGGLIKKAYARVEENRAATREAVAE